MNIKNVERLIAWVVPLVAIQAIGKVATSGIFKSIMDGSSYLGLSSVEALSLISIVGIALTLLVNGAVAVWLSLYARQFDASRLLWFLFGATFGVLALIVFLLVLIYEGRNRKPEEART